MAVRRPTPSLSSLRTSPLTAPATFISPIATITAYARSPQGQQRQPPKPQPLRLAALSMARASSPDLLLPNGSIRAVMGRKKIGTASCILPSSRRDLTVQHLAQYFDTLETTPPLQC